MKANTISPSALLLALLSMVSAQGCLESAPAGPATDPVFSSISVVESNLNHLSSLVAAWETSDGIMGALQIQNDYYPLYSAVTSLNSAVDAVSPIAPNDVSNYISSLNSLVGDISNLLSALNGKANGFQSAGAGSIVAGDITSLAGPASEIESKLLKQLPTNAPCQQVSSAAAICNSLDAAFSGAASAYSISSGIPEFPPAPTACESYCGETAGPSSSPAGATSTAASTTGTTAEAVSSTAPTTEAGTTTPAPTEGGASSAAPTGPCISSAPAGPIDANVDGAISTVISNLDGLKTLVDQWDAAAGLPGALQIQQSYDPLYSAVLSLSTAVEGLSEIAANDVVSYLGPFDTLVSSISGLLSSLNSKANDFQSVGAGQIVGNDIKSLGAPASAIADNLYGAFPSDAPCPAVSSANVVASDLAAAFSGATATYSVEGVPEFPAGPSDCLNYCGGETLPTQSTPAGPGGSVLPTGAASSGAAPSGAASSGAASGAASSGASAAPTPSGSVTSSGAGYNNGTETVVVTQFTTYCPEPTTLCPGNGKCYTVTEPTTLTVTDCPCTIPAGNKPAPAPAPAPGTTKAAVEPDTTYLVTAPVTITRTAASSAPAVVPESSVPAVAPSNGGASVAGSLYAAFVGAVAFALL